MTPPWERGPEHRRHRHHHHGPPPWIENRWSHRNWMFWWMHHRMRHRIFIWFGVAIIAGGLVSHWVGGLGGGGMWQLITALAVVWLASGVIAVRLTRPLIEVVRAARAIGKGDLSVRIAPARPAPRRARRPGRRDQRHGGAARQAAARPAPDAGRGVARAAHAARPHADPGRDRARRARGPRPRASSTSSTARSSTSTAWSTSCWRRRGSSSRSTAARSTSPSWPRSCSSTPASTRPGSRSTGTR